MYSQMDAGTWERVIIQKGMLVLALLSATEERTWPVYKQTVERLIYKRNKVTLRNIRMKR